MDKWNIRDWTKQCNWNQIFVIEINTQNSRYMQGQLTVLEVEASNPSKKVGKQSTYNQCIACYMLIVCMLLS